jgi:hypothetical protein
MTDDNDLTMADVVKTIPNPGDVVQLNGYTIQMVGTYNYEGEEVATMKRYEVEVGDPDGHIGETLDLRDTSEANVRAQALTTEDMIKNPTWVVTKVTQK